MSRFISTVVQGEGCHGWDCSCDRCYESAKEMIPQLPARDLGVLHDLCFVVVSLNKAAHSKGHEEEWVGRSTPAIGTLFNRVHRQALELIDLLDQERERKVREAKRR